MSRISANVPPSRISSGLKALTRPPSAWPSERATAVHRVARALVARARGRDHHTGLEVGGGVGPPGEGEQRVIADVGLEAAVLAAVAFRSGRIDDVVPDLAGVPAVPAQGFTVDDDPGTDADASHQEHDVVVPARCAAAVLGKRGQVGVVAHDDRDVRRRELGEHRSECGVTPAEVGCEADGAGVPVDRARDAHPDTDRHADETALAGELGHRRDDLSRGLVRRRR